MNPPHSSTAIQEDAFFEEDNAGLSIGSIFLAKRCAILQPQLNTALIYECSFCVQYMIQLNILPIVLEHVIETHHQTILL